MECADTYIGELILASTTAIATIAAAYFARQLQVIRSGQDRRLAELEFDLKTIGGIEAEMTKYYTAWFDVFTVQGRIAAKGSTPSAADWNDIHESWTRFSDLSDKKTEITGKLHLLGGNVALDVLHTQRLVFRKHWENLQNRVVMDHEDLRHLSDAVSRHRNDFDRALRKLKKELVADGGSRTA